MDIRFADMDHLNFYKDICARAEAEGKRVDGYFRSLVYLCSLTPDTRAHFADIFDWEGWFIRPESLSAGWQTGGSRRIIRLAFNLWNGCGSDDPDVADVQAEYLPDNLFCDGHMEFFFEALRLRFQMYSSLADRNFSVISC